MRADISLTWLSAFTKSLASLVRRRNSRLTSDANDFVNVENHVREKYLLAGYWKRVTV